MKASRLIGTMVAAAALAAGLGAPTAALADRGGWDHRDRWEHEHRYYGPPYGKAYGHWKHKHHYRRYYAPAYVVPRPPVVVYPAYPVYAPAYPVYPGGQITFSYSAVF
jgi:hypothetical protein